MQDEVADLRSYYESEASQQTRGPLHGPRVDLRDQFVEQLMQEERSTVVDFGAGPGFDAIGFSEAGIQYVGVDLAHGNGVLAAARDVTVVQGSIASPPLRDGSFDAGWSMSTVMHVPEPHVEPVLAAMARTLRPGSPLFVALWGGSLGEHISDNQIAGERRLFSLRTFERNRELLASVGTIERAENLDLGPDDWEYHVFLTRTHQDF